MDMEKNNDERQARRPRRSKADIENAIEKAAIAQIKKKGFAQSQVTDIVKRAKIEPIVFYNRYKNLEEFYEGFVKRYDYWLSDLGKGKRRQTADSGTNAETMRTLLDGLLDNAIVAELLRWEIAEGCHITQRTAAIHEIDFTAYIDRLTVDISEEKRTEARAIFALAIAGLYYIVLHKDRAPFGGFDINVAEDRAEIEKALEKIGEIIAND